MSILWFDTSVMITIEASPKWSLPTSFKEPYQGSDLYSKIFLMLMASTIFLELVIYQWMKHILVASHVILHRIVVTTILSTIDLFRIE